MAEQDGSGPKNPIKIKLTPSSEQPAITEEMLSARQRRRRAPTSEQELIEMRELWRELEEQRRRLEAERAELERRWPPELTHPGFRVATVPSAAIDWAAQPPVPAEKIDWSAQGEPLRVRLTVGAMLAILSFVLSVVGGGAYFYYATKDHLQNQKLHLSDEGIGWGTPAKFESHQQADQRQKKLLEEMQRLRKEQQAQAEKVISEVRRRGRRR